MFRIIQGAPGSGKSFYAVNYLRKFTQYDKLYDTMILDPSVLLVTNIDEVKVSHLSVEEFREMSLVVPEKLKEYMREHSYKRVIYIHDEAQRVYGGVKENREFFFFEYSRHLGIDVFLIVQTVSALPKRLTEVCEYVIDAKPRVLGVIGFHYDIKDPKNGNKLGSITLKKDQNVFRLYKSFDVNEIEPPKKLVLRKFVIGAAVMAMAFVSVTFLIKHAFGVQMDRKEKVFSQPVKEEKKEKKSKKSNLIRERGPLPEKMEVPQYYVYLKDQGANGMRPGGRLKGVSETDKGVYFFYEN